MFLTTPLKPWLLADRLMEAVATRTPPPPPADVAASGGGSKAIPNSPSFDPNTVWHNILGPGGVSIQSHSGEGAFFGLAAAPAEGPSLRFPQRGSTPALGQQQPTTPRSTSLPTGVHLPPSEACGAHQGEAPASAAEAAGQQHQCQPVAAPAMATALQTPPPAGVRWLPEVARQAVPVRKTRILVVEDNHMNQRVVIGILKRFFDQPPTVANDGLEGVEAVRSGFHDIILMDMQARF